jgi:uncharacterized membrane protein
MKRPSIDQLRYVKLLFEVALLVLLVPLVLWTLTKDRERARMLGMQART